MPIAEYELSHWRFLSQEHRFMQLQCCLTIIVCNKRYVESVGSVLRSRIASSPNHHLQKARYRVELYCMPLNTPHPYVTGSGGSIM